MKRTKTIGGRLPLAALATVTAVAASPGIVRGDTQPRRMPAIDFRVTPDIGRTGSPVVRIERIRRGTDEPGPAGGLIPPDPIDTGMINFEVEVTNNDVTSHELAELRTHFYGQPNPLPNGVFDAFENADLLDLPNGAWGYNGTRIDDPDTSGSEAEWASAVTGVYFDGDYVVGGMAAQDGEMKFYVSRRSDYNGKIRSESMPAPGMVRDMVVVPATATTPAAVVAVGSTDDGGNQTTLVARYVSDGDNGLVLDPAFGSGGLVHIDIPFHDKERATAVAAVVHSGSPYILVAGVADYGGEERRFLVRLEKDGSLDAELNTSGIQILPASGKSRWPVAVGMRDDWGPLFAPNIYLLERVGESCGDHGDDCRGEITRRTWTGATDAGFGDGGTATLEFFGSKADIPFDFALIEGSGNIYVGFNRVELGSDETYAGVTRVLVDGSIDYGFGGNGYGVAQVGSEETAGRAIGVQGSRLAVAGATIEPGARKVAMLLFENDGTLVSAEDNRQAAPQFPLTGDLIVGPNDKLVAVAFESGQVQLTRFRPEGRLDWRGIIDAGEMQRIFWPDYREMKEFPTSLRLETWFEGLGAPYNVDAGVKEDAVILRFPLPALPGNMAYRVNQQHRLRDNHRGALSQRYAYDFGGRMFSGNDWQSRYNNVDPDLNKSFVIWGLPISAARGGKLTACWRAAPNNSVPGEKTEYYATPMPAGGNMIEITHKDGTIAHYSHFQAGSIDDICPNTCTEYDSDSSNTWTDPAQTSCSEHLGLPWDELPEITVSQFLGLVGNSGNSTGPHLHFHVMDQNGSGVPVYFEKVGTDLEMNLFDLLGPFALLGTAAPAPPLDDIYNLLFAD